jgi:hypothetical protein
LLIAKFVVFFSGPLDYISQLTALTEFEATQNRFTGTLRAFQTLTRITTLDLYGALLILNSLVVLLNAAMSYSTFIYILILI